MHFHILTSSCKYILSNRKMNFPKEMWSRHYLVWSWHFVREVLLAEQFIQIDRHPSLLKWEKVQRRFIKEKMEAINAFLWYLHNTLNLTRAADEEGLGAGLWPHWLVDGALLEITTVFGGDWLGTTLLSLPIVDQNDNLLCPMKTVKAFLSGWEKI